MKKHKHDRTFPYLSFPSDWEVQPVPQFGGSYWRFLVRKRGSRNHGVSVYLDVDDSLGAMGVPYWEICPEDVHATPSRFLVGEEEQLMAALAAAIK
jgi:hypothetical protein